MKQTKYQLKNKMNVLLIESKKSPVVSVQMWVKTGSADEKKSEEGISHFIEHLVFKGTERFKVGEIANLVEASGGELNAYTSFDQTVFYVTISKNFRDVALSVISQMMGHPLFDPAEIDSEREVVCEEIKMGLDSPGRRSSQLVFSTAFKKHPYGKPVIGYEKNVRSWSAKKIKSFYQSRYVPSNMFLVVSGDFETAEMKSLVQSYFADFQPYKLKKIKRDTEPKQKKFQHKAQKYKIQDQHLHFVFRAPPVRHADVPALDILAMVLGQGDSSLLVKKLRLEKPLASSISAFSYNPQDAGLFAVTAHYQGEKFSEISEEIIRQLLLVQTDLVSWEQIKRARVSISSEQFYAVETVEGLANKAGSQEFYFKDQSAQKKYLQKINRVTPEDVRRVARKYLQLSQMSAAYLGDRDEKKSEADLKTIPSTWKKLESKIKTELKNKPAAKLKKPAIPNLLLKPAKAKSQNQVELVTLKNGVRILFKEEKDTPTVSAKVVYRGGARLESAAQMGLCELTSRCWISGTKNLSEAEQLQAIEENAIGLSAFSGKNTSGFSLEYLSAFEDKALELFADSALNPSFSSEVLEREKAIMLQTIKSRQDHPSSQCMKQFSKAMFGEHPLAFETLGTAQTLPPLDRAQAQEMARKVISQPNCVVVVVGDYNKKKWIATVEQLTAGIKNKKEKTTEQPLAPLTGDKREFLEIKKEQSHVIVGWRGLSLHDPDRYALHIIEAVLAGQGGRLFFELRDKSSLAYSVSPIRMESLETGYFGGYIACSHEKVEKSIEMFHAEFKKICEQKISSEELQRAQRYLIGQHDIGLQKKSGLCNLIAFDEIYGNDFNESLHVANQYMKVTAEQVQSVARRLFTQPCVTSVAGA